MDDVVSFAISGSPPFKICSITIGAFQTAGGITLFCGAMGMRHAQAPRMMHTPEELEEGMGREDIAVVPLAIPMVTGLGAITTVIVLASEASTPPDMIVLFAALVATIATVWVKLHNAARIGRFLGPSGLNITTRSWRRRWRGESSGMEARPTRPFLGRSP